MKTFYTKNAEETKDVAAELVKTWKGGDVVGLVGDLGAGKTTFVQYLEALLPSGIICVPMSIRKVQFATGEYYHVFNRGVDKRDVFLDEENFERFFESMEDFNALAPIGSLHEHRFRKRGIEKEFGPPEPLVHIICYCLNPNHYHFLLEQVADRGVEKFMQRIGTGYTKYFNIKYQRSGSLFQGKFKAAHLNSDEYLLHVSAYINLNHRVHRLGSKASKSSWGEYLGQVAERDALCKKDIILKQFEDRAAYKNFALRALPRIQERKDLQSVIF